MAIEPADFLKIASALLKEDTEACHRSSASRAYYAAYHFCKPLAERLPEGRSSRRGSHQRLIDRLRKHAVRARTRQKDRKIRDIGGFWEKGRLLRIEADYRIDRNFASANAVELLRAAEKIQHLLQEVAEA